MSYRRYSISHDTSDDEYDPFEDDDRPWPDCLLERSADEGLKPGWTRKTFITRKKHIKKIRQLAKEERRTQKDLVDEALNAFLEKYYPFGN